jgi:hypothetical protein
MGWSGIPFDSDPPRLPFAWPDEDKYRAVLEQKYRISPTQVIICKRNGDFLYFSKRELKGVYYYYTPLETVYSPVKKLLW